MRLKNPRVILVVSLLLLTLAALSAFFLGHMPVRVSAQAGCTNCYNAGTDAPWTWAQNTRVRVNISSSYNADQQREIRQAFLNWQNNPATDAGVTFEFVNEPFGGFQPNTVTVLREAPPADDSNTPGDTSDDTQPVAQTDPQFNSTNTRLQSAIIRVHPSVTNLVALLEAMAHEIGHLYGLNDCNACCPGSSSMTGAPFACLVPCTNSNYFNDVTQGTSGPAGCDAASAKQAGGYNAATECPDANGNGVCDGNDGGGGGGGDGGGGDGGGGGGGDMCNPEYVEQCGYDDQCDDWDAYTGTCSIDSGYDYCTGYWTDCP